MKSLSGFHQGGFWDDSPRIPLKHQPPRCMMHLHQAPSWLHVDFRFQVSGKFWSWAFAFEHLTNLYKPCRAVHVNDHSLSCYGDEGITFSTRGIGYRLVLDQGIYTVVNARSRPSLYKAMKDALYCGKIRIVLDTKKLAGAFIVTRKSRLNEKEWFLQKEWDKYAVKPDERIDLRSLVSGRTMDEVRRDCFPGSDAA